MNWLSPRLYNPHEHRAQEWKAYPISSRGLGLQVQQGGKGGQQPPDRSGDLHPPVQKVSQLLPLIL
jgi:hypothetical protein